MSHKLSAKHPGLRALVARTFPAYRGRTFSLETAGTVTFSGLNWSGGSRTEYVLVNLQTGDTRKVDNHRAPWTAFNMAASTERWPLPPHGIVVEHAIFCGKDAGIRIVVHPSLFNRALETLELTVDAALPTSSAPALAGGR